ncbi:MAG: DUF1080 domain-containing protein [Planctomycetaceae bacterium]
MKPARMIAAFAGLLAFGSSPAETPAGDETPAKPEPGFVSIFNGKDLTGWEGNRKLWKVADGKIVGDSPGITRNEFLATKKRYHNFELRLEFRMKDGKGNSGVQFRSKRLPKSSAVQGYQADIGARFWGCLYDEHRRRKVLARAPASQSKVLKKGVWNTYVIRAKGNHVVMTVNGLKTVDYTERDKTVARKGILALQIHSGPPMRVEFRNIRIKVLADRP